MPALCGRTCSSSNARPQEQFGSVFAAAKVHTLASWFEVPWADQSRGGPGGLQRRVHGRGQHTSTCRTWRGIATASIVDSIRRGPVLAAYAAPRSARLRPYTSRTYRWAQAAAQHAGGVSAGALAPGRRSDGGARPRARRQALRQHAGVARAAGGATAVRDPVPPAGVQQSQTSTERHVRHLEQRGSQLEGHVGNRERALQQRREETDRVTSRRHPPTRGCWEAGVEEAAAGVEEPAVRLTVMIPTYNDARLGARAAGPVGADAVAEALRDHRGGRRLHRQHATSGGGGGVPVARLRYFRQENEPATARNYGCGRRRGDRPLHRRRTPAALPRCSRSISADTTRTTWACSAMSRGIRK